MSQEKIDRRKEEKSRRKQEIVKKKRLKPIKILGGILAGAAFIALVVLSALLLKGDIGPKEEETSTTMSSEQMSMLESYINAQTTDSSGTTAANEATTAASEANTTAK